MAARTQFKARKVDWTRGGLVRQTPLAIALEPRMMFDAAAVATVVEAVSAEQPAPPPEPTADSGAADLGAALEVLSAMPSEPARTEIVFVDSALKDSQALLDMVKPGTEVVLITGGDGLAQMADHMVGSGKLYDAVHILSHGSEGVLTLGGSRYTASSLANDQASLIRIGSTLTSDGDILLYGCDTGKGTVGQVLLQALADGTGADVAASNDATGAAEKGGDWELEIKRGQVDAALPFDSYGYGRLLAVPPDNTTLQEITYFSTSSSWNKVFTSEFFTVVASETLDAGNWQFTNIPSGQTWQSITVLCNGTFDVTSAMLRWGSLYGAPITSEYYFFGYKAGVLTGTAMADINAFDQSYTGMPDFSSGFDDIDALTIRIRENPYMGYRPFFDSLVIADVRPGATGSAGPVLSNDSGFSPVDNITKTVGGANSLSFTAATTVGNGSIELFDDLDNDGVLDGDEAVSAGSLASLSSNYWRFNRSNVSEGVHYFRYIHKDASGTVIAVSAATMVMVDNTAPAKPATPTLPALQDSGASNSDAITNSPTVEVSGEGSAGIRYKLSYNGSTTISGEVGAGYSMSLPWTWEGNAWQPSPDGVYTFSVSTVDLAGNESEASDLLTIVVDRTLAVNGMPGLASGSDSGATGDGHTNTLRPTFTGTTDPGVGVDVIVDGVTVATVTADATTGVWTWTPSGDFAEGAHNIKTTARDTAGNTLTSSLFSFVIDTTAPAQPGTPDMQTGSDSGSSSTDNITNAARPVFQGTAEANATVEIFLDGASKGTVIADGTGAWTWTPGVDIAAGAHALTVRASDRAGNASPLSEPLAFSVDKAINISTPALAAGSVSATLSYQARPTITGTAEAGATVEIFVDGSSIGSAVADAITGVWNWTPATNLADGAHTVQATARDAAGNVQTSIGLNFTIDTDHAPPVNGSDVLDLFAGQSGTVLNSEFFSISSHSLLQVAANGAMSIPIGGDEIGGQYITIAGKTLFQLRGLKIGSDGVTLRATVTGYLDGQPQFADSFSINGTAEFGTAGWLVDNVKITLTDYGGMNYSRYTISDLIVSDVGVTNYGSNSTLTGFQTSDGRTVTGTSVNDDSLVFRGTTLPGARLEGIQVGMHSLGEVTADSSGNWTIDARGLDLPPGQRYLIFTIVDDDTPVTDMAIHGFTIDLTPPAAPVITSIDGDSGASTSDGITKDPTLVLRGTAEPGSTVSILKDGSAVGNCTADAQGNWSFDYSGISLADGVYRFVAVAKDAATNVSPASAETVVTIDTQLALSAAWAPASDTGAADGVTSQNRPTLSFTAEAGSTLEVDWGDGVGFVAAGTGTGAAQSLMKSAAYNLDGTKTVTLRATDLAGNVATRTVVLTLDTAPPAAPAITGVVQGSSDPSWDGRVNQTEPTIQGTAEAGAQVQLFRNGILVGTAVANGNGDWSYTFTTALAVGDHAFTAKAIDLAGNESVVSLTFYVTVDISPPAKPAMPDMRANSDTGVSPTDNVTNAPRPVFTGTVEPHALVEIVVDDSAVGAVYSDSSGNWTWTPSIDLVNGNHSLAVLAVDQAGNASVSSDSLSFIIDRSLSASAPAFAAGADSGTAGDSITSVKRPGFTGSADKGASVEIFLDGASQGTVTADAVTGLWAWTPGGDLAAGAHSINVVVTDQAGNSSNPAAFAFSIDAEPTITALSADRSWSKVGNSINFTLTPSESVTIAAGGSLSISVGGVTRTAIYNAGLSSSSALVYSYAVQAGDADSDGIAVLGLSGQNIKDVAGHQLSFATETATTAKVDTTAPDKPSVPDMMAGSDSGISNSDNVTSSVRPMFQGTAEPNSLVEVLIDGTSYGTTTVSGLGAWSFQPGMDLVPGEHALTIRAFDGQGHASEPSDWLVFTIDTSQTVHSTPAFALGADSGSVGDALTKLVRPGFTGLTEAGAAVEVFVDGVSKGTMTANALTGVWSWTPSSDLSEGSHTIGVVVTDLAGNAGASDTFTFTVDNSAPAAPAAPSLDSTSDTGASNSDGNTANPRPTFSGSVAAHAPVEVFLDGVSQGIVTADSSGLWAWTPGSDLIAGSHTLSVKLGDAAGNVSAASPGLVFTIDGEVFATSAPSLAGVAGSVSANAQPAFQGSTEANATVQIVVDGSMVGTVTASPSGAWSFALPSELADGAHRINANVTDAAGNTTSTALAFIIDTEAPAKPATPALSTSGDRVTLRGTVEAGALVDVYDGAIKIGSAVAEDSGSWTFLTGLLSAGPHSFQIRAMDAAGHVSEMSDGVELTVESRSVHVPQMPVPQPVPAPVSVSLPVVENRPFIALPAGVPTQVFASDGGVPVFSRFGIDPLGMLPVPSIVTSPTVGSRSGMGPMPRLETTPPLVRSSIQIDKRWIGQLAREDEVEQPEDRQPPAEEALPPVEPQAAPEGEAPAGPETGEIIMPEDPKLTVRPSFTAQLAAAARSGQGIHRLAAALAAVS